jgi:hypothetical protein
MAKSLSMRSSTIKDHFRSCSTLGGVEAITPETATALGLLVEGQGTGRGSGERAVSVAFTHLQTLRVGGAELSDIALPVIHYRNSSRTVAIGSRSPVLSGLVFSVASLSGSPMTTRH